MIDSAGQKLAYVCYEAMAELPALDYPNPRDELAEHFHMSEQLLATLNPGADSAAPALNPGPSL